MNAKSGTSVLGGTWFQSYLGTGQPIGACPLFAKEERKLDLLTSYGYDLTLQNLLKFVSLSFWFIGLLVCWSRTQLLSEQLRPATGPRRTILATMFLVQTVVDVSRLGTYSNMVVGWLGMILEKKLRSLEKKSTFPGKTGKKT